jgi:hypothetical protein
MHRIRLIGSALVVAIAFGVTAAGASAAKTTLVLKEELGPRLAVGASVGMYIELPLEECVLEGSALVGVNGAKRDILDKPTSVTLCEDSEVPGGSIQEIQLSIYRKVTVVSTPGDLMRVDPFLEGCVYEFKKLTGTLETPGVTVVTGEAKGKLSKTYTTATGCEKKLITEFTLVVEMESELVTG